MRRASAVDSNQAEIVAALRKRGHLVQSLAAVGGGVPDLLVGVSLPTAQNASGHFMLLEVKDGRKVPSARRLTPLETAWHAAFKGFPVAVVHCAEDAVRAVEGGA